KVFGEYVVGKVSGILKNQSDISLEIPEIIKTMSKFKDGKFPSGQFSAKLIVCGAYKVGKTSLIRRFVDKSFNASYIPTLGVNISKKKIKLSEDCHVNFLIWDIGGQIQQMAPYRKKFYSGANAAFLILDKTRKKTYSDPSQGIEMWNNEISSEISENIPKIIIGNKNDMSDNFEVSTQEIKELADKINVEFIETSAKTGENVNEAFKFMAIKQMERI
ncbi:MAG: Rab family GTPase, partial [Promethearchaeota archaeon]